jgi:hypothetical protein
MAGRLPSMSREQQARILAVVFIAASIALIGAIAADWLWGWSYSSVALEVEPAPM